MLQFAISVDEKTQQLNWVGNISPAQAISLMTQYLESSLVQVKQELEVLKKGAVDVADKHTQ